MLEVSMKTQINASADDVWKTISDFGAIDKFLPIAKSVELEGEGIGAVRTITGEDGSKIIESLDASDAEAKSLTYSIKESALPIDNYTSTMTVTKSEEGKCEFTWSSTFNAKGVSDEEAKTLIGGVYTAGFGGLKKIHGG